MPPERDILRPRTMPKDVHSHSILFSGIEAAAEIFSEHICRSRSWTSGEDKRPEQTALYTLIVVFLVVHAYIITEDREKER